MIKNTVYFGFLLDFHRIEILYITSNIAIKLFNVKIQLSEDFRFNDFREFRALKSKKLCFNENLDGLILADV